MRNLQEELLEYMFDDNIIAFSKLLDDGLSPNFKDRQNKTPLEKAIDFKKVHFVKYLLKNGAKADVKNSLKETLLYRYVLSELNYRRKSRCYT